MATTFRLKRKNFALGGGIGSILKWGTGMSNFGKAINGTRTISTTSKAGKAILKANPNATIKELADGKKVLEQTLSGTQRLGQAAIGATKLGALTLGGVAIGKTVGTTKNAFTGNLGNNNKTGY